MQINVSVREKIAVRTGDAVYICGNSGYTVLFDFDEEWSGLEVKTARFITEDGRYFDQVFTGDECPVPIIENTRAIRVGVYAGNLQTTTPARVPAAKSILCGGGLPADPQPDVYAQLMVQVGAIKGATDDLAQSTQEAYGDGGVFLVTAYHKPDSGIQCSNRTNEEIRAAVAAGKTCLLVDCDRRVYYYYGEMDYEGENDGETLPMFISPGGYTAGKGIEGTKFARIKTSSTYGTWIATSYYKIAKTPNPNKLVFRGAVSATYDGSEYVNVEIPEGATPEAIQAAVEQYLTDNPAGGVSFETDESLTLENGVLSVNTADAAEADNTLPITSAAVHTTVGNINAMLETI